MKTHTRVLSRSALAALLLFLFPLAAAAQDTSASQAPGAGQGPMIVERVRSGFLAAPEVKVTRFDNKTSELVGGYAGWLSDQTFFIGGAGYWLANHSRDRELGYGGIVFGIMSRTDKAVGFSVKGLLGGGRANRTESITLLDDPDIRIPALGPSRSVTLPTRVVDVRVRDDFFLAEPEANVTFNFSRRFRLTAGAGYRFTGTDRYRRDGLNGPTGNISFQIGG
jgi:hypothetical protein